MSEESPSAASTRPGGSWRGRIVVVGLVALLAAGAAMAYGSRLGATVARQMAFSRMSRSEFGPALRWLARSAWLDPGDYRSDLLAAACHRQGMNREAWTKCLNEARRKGAPRERLAVELKLSRFQKGDLYEGAETEMGDLCLAGASQSDVLTAFLYGYLTRGNAEVARTFLDGIPHYFADEAHREFLWGIYLRQQGDLHGAETRLTTALALRPGHESARAQLADLLEVRDKPSLALRQYVELAIRSGGNDAATLGLARELRQTARLDEARAVLAPLVSRSEITPLVQLEMAAIELESGNYEEAWGRFARIPLDELGDEAFPAALTLALRKKPLDAESLFAKAAASTQRNGWISELQLRLARNPGDRAAAEELRRLSRPAPPLTPDLPGSVPDPIAASSAGNSAATAAELYRGHCIACHGAKGDGFGPAARYLFPRARDLRNGRCQLVSTLNGVPTLEDIERVLAQGMPGASMPSFQELPEADRKLLAQEVLRLRRDGLRDQIARALRQEGEEVDEADVRQAVESSATPGQRVRLPRSWPALGRAAEKGKASYMALGCNKCHGEDGVGSPDATLFDDLGEPMRPRDLVHEPFKGGREPESIAIRITAGMPGTAHPAVWNLPEQELIELVDYVRSLAREPQRLLTNDERRIRASRSMRSSGSLAARRAIRGGPTAVGGAVRGS